ncbi:MAG: quinolinate synthase NadA [Nitrospirae bacterium]|nr:quinolinate synthase NadA [Nitrospirota bacterium]MBI3594478.1 quinolinate synthase NadA [Nitrospirota bacterium]
MRHLKSEQDLVARITELKREKKAIILSHNYQIPEVQDVADYLGDSLELSIKASKTDAKVIVFCGVHFMAETAAILSPEKVVLMPDIHSGCPMADMITVEQLKELKAEHPGAVVVCYVNTSAEIKAESDICCTSSNAVKVVQSIPREKKIIFIPDKHLARFVEGETGRKMIIFDGYCPSHVRMMAEELHQAQERYRDAPVLVHPEAPADIIQEADQILSTSGICRVAKESESSTIIVATEPGILYRLEKENPEKTFVPACKWCNCANMKLNTLEKILWVLEDMENQVKVPVEIQKKARSAVEKMLQIAA